MRTVLLRGVVLAGAAALGAMTVASAQPGLPSNESVLAALLIEVRGLRAAMEQMAAAGPRVQLALGRLQLQEQRLNTMLRRLDGVRDAVSAVERGLAQSQREVEEREQKLKDPEIQTHPQREAILKTLTEQVAGLKRRAALDAPEGQRLQTEQSTLEQQIATEQGRWSEINRALEDLERALGKR